MARNNSNGALKFFGAAAAAIVGGVAIGYLFGGGRTLQTPEPIPQQPIAPVSTPAAPVAPPIVRPRMTNGNYTAPGAPRIVIHEESTPILRRVDRTVPPVPADTEASQEASPPAKPAPPDKASDKSPNASPANTGSSSDVPASPSGTATNTTPPDNTMPPPSPPADPDFEHVGKPSDPESGQEGGGKAQFRVQTGSYTDESHARSIADQLRSQGYSTSTRSEREGDHLIYKVQAGAYRSKNGADKAAADLQKKGFPAYVSPIAP